MGTALAHKVPGGVGHRRRMYEMFDRQRRGAIGLEDFRTGCFELGLRLSPVEALAVFGFCDARVDGLINYYGAGIGCDGIRRIKKAMSCMHTTVLPFLQFCLC